MGALGFAVLSLANHAYKRFPGALDAQQLVTNALPRRQFRNLPYWSLSQNNLKAQVQDNAVQFINNYEGRDGLAAWGRASTAPDGVGLRPHPTTAVHQGTSTGFESLLQRTGDWVEKLHPPLVRAHGDGPHGNPAVGPSLRGARPPANGQDRTRMKALVSDRFYPVSCFLPLTRQNQSKAKSTHAHPDCHRRLATRQVPTAWCAPSRTLARLTSRRAGHEAIAIHGPGQCFRHPCRVQTYPEIRPRVVSGRGRMAPG